MIEPQRIRYCRRCALVAFSNWRGWPHKSTIPLLPRLEQDTCGACGEAESVDNELIAWVNHHGPYNTGLPDYWYLAAEHDPLHWGRPYYAEGACPKCKGRTVISEMKYPNGRRELKHNCPACGLRHAG